VKIKSKNKKTYALEYDSIPYEVTPKGIELPDAIATTLAVNYRDIVEIVEEQEEEKEQEVEQIELEIK